MDDWYNHGGPRRNLVGWIGEIAQRFDVRTIGPQRSIRILTNQTQPSTGYLAFHQWPALAQKPFYPLQVWQVAQEADEADARRVNRLPSRIVCRSLKPVRYNMNVFSA